jgi:hypothetical protein
MTTTITDTRYKRIFFLILRPLLLTLCMPISNRFGVLNFNFLNKIYFFYQAIVLL